MNTVERMARDLIEALHDEDAEDAVAFISENAAGEVPVITTALFAMVVEDNALAFLDSPVESGEPFAVLHAAIAAEVERVALQIIENEREEPET